MKIRPVKTLWFWPYYRIFFIFHTSKIIYKYLEFDLDDFDVSLELLRLQETEELLLVLLKFDCESEVSVRRAESETPVLSEVSVRPVVSPPEVTSWIGADFPMFSPDVKTDVFISNDENV